MSYCNFENWPWVMVHQKTKYALDLVNKSLLLWKIFVLSVFISKEYFTLIYKLYNADTRLFPVWGNMYNIMNPLNCIDLPGIQHYGNIWTPPFDFPDKQLKKINDHAIKVYLSFYLFGFFSPGGLLRSINLPLSDLSFLMETFGGWQRS